MIEGPNDQNIATTLIALKLSKILIIIFSELFDTKKLQRLGGTHQIVVLKRGKRWSSALHKIPCTNHSSVFRQNLFYSYFHETVIFLPQIT